MHAIGGGHEYKLKSRKLQDSRCTKEFLETLPKPDSHLNVHSGYGCATIFWFQRNKPEKLEQYDRAATIQARDQ
jgi:sedoheptulokinase